MSIPGGGSPLLLGGGPQQYKIERSIRLNASDSAYLSRTPASAGNRKTWSYSFWLKRTNFGAIQSYLFSGPNGSGDSYVFFNTTDTFAIGTFGSGAWTWLLESSAVFRDSSAWCHFVVSIDTTQVTASERAKIYVNGSQITAFSTSTYPSQNFEGQINNNAFQNKIGADAIVRYSSGYLADIHFIDGQALTPSSFAETNITTGQWVPKAYTGTYGTNGFRLAFADNSNNTATTLGKDSSPNGNNWTPNNLSVTAGAGNDSLVDTPTSYGTDTGAGGEVRGNYATWNPLNVITANGAALTNGNLDTALANATAYGSIAIPTSGKWYFEVQTVTIFDAAGYVNGGTIGIVKLGTNSFSGVNVENGIANDGGIFKNDARVQTLRNAVAGDIYGVAYDADSFSMQIYRNGAAYGSAVTLDSAQYIPRVTGNGSNLGNANTQVANFGQRPFAYTAPSGFKALCDTNLPAPVVAKPSTVMDVKTYTGNGSTQTISGLGFSPDLVWIKQRDTVRDNQLQDTVRGVGKELQSNAANSEGSYGLISSFNSDGFTVFTDGTYLASNQSGGSYAAWCWDAGSSTTTNNSGSISSQVRANASAGFSIVTWTGDGAASASVGHGLGVAPRLYLTKCRDSIGGVFDNWGAFTTATGSMLYGFLNTTAAFGTPGQSAPTSTTINVLSGFENVSGKRFVAYCFAPVAGYSSFGSYTGNGSTDGPFVFTGMRPRWIMLKRTDSTGNWTIIDTAREGYNVDNDPLYPNLSDAEGTADLADILSNGFKLRSTDASVNASAGTYVYACFAEAPFGLARAR